MLIKYCTIQVLNSQTTRLQWQNFISYIKLCSVDEIWLILTADKSRRLFISLWTHLLPRRHQWRLFGLMHRKCSVHDDGRNFINSRLSQKVRTTHAKIWFDSDRLSYTYLFNFVFAVENTLQFIPIVTRLENRLRLMSEREQAVSESSRSFPFLFVSVVPWAINAGWKGKKIEREKFGSTQPAMCWYCCKTFVAHTIVEGGIVCWEWLSSTDWYVIIEIIWWKFFRIQYSVFRQHPNELNRPRWSWPQLLWSSQFIMDISFSSQKHRLIVDRATRPRRQFWSENFSAMDTMRLWDRSRITPQPLASTWRCIWRAMILWV